MSFKPKFVANLGYLTRYIGKITIYKSKLRINWSSKIKTYFTCEACEQLSYPTDLKRAINDYLTPFSEEYHELQIPSNKYIWFNLILCFRSSAALSPWHGFRNIILAGNKWRTAQKIFNAHYRRLPKRKDVHLCMRILYVRNRRCARDTHRPVVQSLCIIRQ